MKYWVDLTSLAYCILTDFLGDWLDHKIRSPILPGQAQILWLMGVGVVQCSLARSCFEIVGYQSWPVSYKILSRSFFASSTAMDPSHSRAATARRICMPFSSDIASEVTTWIGNSCMHPLLVLNSERNSGSGE